MPQPISSLTVRSYRPDDRDRVQELHEVALRAAGGYVEPAVEPDLATIQAVYKESGRFVVGTLEDRIVAMGGVRPAAG